MADLTLLIQNFEHAGLDLNFSKCEIFIPEISTDKKSVIQKFNSIAPNIKIIEKESLRLLGSPILEESFTSFVDEKLTNFLFVSDRITKINAHMAYTIIKFCLFAPKFIYSVRSSPFWKHPSLTSKLDDSIQNILSLVLNIPLDDQAWAQASLPIRFGGLGIRKISSVALPAFLASVHKTEELISKILSKSRRLHQTAHVSEAIDRWKSLCSDDVPNTTSSQRQWDEPLCRLARNNLLNTQTSPASQARLLAVAKWESG